MIEVVVRPGKLRLTFAEAKTLVRRLNDEIDRVESSHDGDSCDYDGQYWRDLISVDLPVEDDE